MVLFLKNLLFTVLVPGVLAGYLPIILVRPTGVPLAGAGLRAIPALVFLGFGMLTYFLCIWGFAVTGKGTPAPIDAPKSLVVAGLYHYVRNPMYLGVLSVVLGWGILTAAPVLVLYLMGLAGAFHLFVIGYEEPTLRRRFGTAYEEYCAAVPRWLPSRGAARQSSRQ
jgi:protein-S-isoprenylcysteine O-methyltransferase Ste14